MTELTDAYRNLMSGTTIPDDSLLIPLLRWVSGSYENVETCQGINKRLFYGNHKVYIQELALNNTVKNFIRYPKAPKNEPKLSFFYKDAAKYFGWTTKELQKNISVLDMNTLKPIIAKIFGYNDSERKLIGLGKLLGLRKYINR